MSYFQGGSDEGFSGDKWTDEYDQYGRHNPLDAEYDTLREDVTYWATGLEPGQDGYEEAARDVDMFLGESASPHDIGDYFAEEYGGRDYNDYPWHEWEEWMGYE